MAILRSTAGVAWLLWLVGAGCATNTGSDDESSDEPPTGDDPPADGPADDGSQDPAEAVCGDGVRDRTELCDPCPEVCEPRACNVAFLEGDPAQCGSSCRYELITECRSGDGCCASGCDLASDTDCDGVRLDSHYAGAYELEDLGAPPGVPQPLGALIIDRQDRDRLFVGGNANNDQGALYEVFVVRDSAERITGFAQDARRMIDAAYNDGGIVYADDDVLLLARWPVNELGQTTLGSSATDKIVSLYPVGVVYSIAGVMIVPAGFPGEGLVKGVSWPGGEWYTLEVAPDGDGTFDVHSASLEATIGGGPEGMVYVPEGSPLFDAHSVLVSEFQAGEVSTYEIDESGDPLPDTRRQFIIGLDGAEGATIDATSGDFLFSTWGTDEDHIVAVHGFSPIE